VLALAVEREVHDTNVWASTRAFRDSTQICVKATEYAFISRSSELTETQLERNHPHDSGGRVFVWGVSRRIASIGRRTWLSHKKICERRTVLRDALIQAPSDPLHGAEK